MVVNSNRNLKFFFKKNPHNQANQIKFNIMAQWGKPSGKGRKFVGKALAGLRSSKKIYEYDTIKICGKLIQRELECRQNFCSKIKIFFKKVFFSIFVSLLVIVKKF